MFCFVLPSCNAFAVLNEIGMVFSHTFLFAYQATMYVYVFLCVNDFLDCCFPKTAMCTLLGKKTFHFSFVCFGALPYFLALGDPPGSSCVFPAPVLESAVSVSEEQYSEIARKYVYVYF